MKFLDTLKKAREDRANFIEKIEEKKAAAEQTLTQTLANVEVAKQAYMANASDTSYQKIKEEEKAVDAQKAIIAECKEYTNLLGTVKVAYQEETIIEELKGIVEEKGLVEKLDTILEKQAELEALKEQYTSEHNDFMSTVIKTTHAVNKISGLKYQGKHKLRDKINNYVDNTLGKKTRAAGINVETYTLLVNYDRD